MTVAPPAAARTDAHLVARCRAGDDAAWAELVARFGRYVTAILTRAYRLPASDAEDVFQDVFARVHERLGELRDPAALRPWIGQLTRRLAVDRLRAARHGDPRAAIADVGEPDAALARLDEALAVRAALVALPEHCREILDRFFARDESYRTISASLGLPAGTVASRLSRCLDQLREHLAGVR
jgi:RNA polymerase sigma factor (sigma-70 family)